MVRWSWRTAANTAAALTAVAALAFGALPVLAQTTPAAGSASVRVEAPPGELPKGTNTVDVQVMVDNVENLGGFQFILNFDPNVLKATGADAGPFLGSSGREVLCNDPTIDDGAIRLSCVTLRQLPAGAVGSGLLATVHLDVIGSGRTDLSLDRVMLNTPPGQSIPMSGVTGSSLVAPDRGGGFNWMLWGPVIGVIVAVLAVAGGGGLVLASRRAGRGLVPQRASQASDAEIAPPR